MVLLHFHPVSSAAIENSNAIFLDILYVFVSLFYASFEDLFFTCK